MHDDADFLAAVGAKPQDPLTRLVYADWLDERSDPRGELVRIEEEVRFEPAWSEVLWSQKPRRNDLRAMCDPAWLAAMRYGTDCLPLFYGRPFPDDWRDGWRLIREATERWLGVTMPDVGGHADEVAAVESRLGLTLPPSVREFVAYVHDSGEIREGDLCWHGDICRFEVLPEVETLSLIEMSAGGEGRFSVNCDELELPDPPLHRYDEIWEFVDGSLGRWIVPSRRWNRWATLTQFMFDQVFLSRMSATDLLRVELGDKAMVLNTLREDFASVVSTATGIVYFESEHFFGEVRRTIVRESCYLNVCGVNPVTAKQVPNSLQRLMGHGGSPSDHFGGVFADIRRRSRR